MTALWNKQLDGVSYDEGQLFNIMFHKILGFGKAEAKKFFMFEEGCREVVCSVGVAILDREALGFDPASNIDIDLIDPGVLEKSKEYVDVALCNGDEVIKIF